jgi:hypothetical protein
MRASTATSQVRDRCMASKQAALVLLAGTSLTWLSTGAAVEWDPRTGHTCTCLLPDRDLRCIYDISSDESFTSMAGQPVLQEQKPMERTGRSGSGRLKTLKTCPFITCIIEEHRREN